MSCGVSDLYMSCKVYIWAGGRPGGQSRVESRVQILTHLNFTTQKWDTNMTGAWHDTTKGDWGHFRLRGKTGL